MGIDGGFGSAAGATGAEGVACTSGADTDWNRGVAGGVADRCTETYGN